jgi:hypothetical protein
VAITRREGTGCVIAEEAEKRRLDEMAASIVIGGKSGLAVMSEAG